MKEAARRIAGLGAKAVLVKGGHLTGMAVDVLYFAESFHEYSAPRSETRHTHGTGCTFSAAITAGLARGDSLSDAVAVPVHRYIVFLSYDYMLKNNRNNKAKDCRLQ
jgi:hydroxymethylpyrimidine/phosphomethylpyrimidine kinase